MINERRYKVPPWVENWKVTHVKIWEIPVGWEFRQKLGIIPKEEEDFQQRSLLPSYERHPNHWGFPSRLSPPGYLSLAHKLPCTSEGQHNMNFRPRNTLQEHTSKWHEESMNVPLTHKKGWNRKVLENQPKVELAKDTPPICHGGRDA